MGIKHLRAYLDLAATGTGVLEHASRRVSAPDRHREDIADALRDRGLMVATDVGLSDFRIDLSISLPEDAARPAMAVLLDGSGWASRRTRGRPRRAARRGAVKDAAVAERAAHLAAGMA